MELEHIEDLMSDAMGGDVLESNLEILHDAYEMVEDEFETGHDLRAPTGDHETEQALLSGSNAIAYGAIDAGCRFIAGYPMTPWTDVFTILSQNFPIWAGFPSRSRTKSPQLHSPSVRATPASRRCPAPPVAASP